MPPSTSRTQLYPALAWFYHTEYRGQAIRVARLLQPINEGGIVGMAEIYIAETLQSRRWLPDNYSSHPGCRRGYWSC